MNENRYKSPLRVNWCDKCDAAQGIKKPDGTCLCKDCRKGRQPKCDKHKKTWRKKNKDK